MLIPGMALQSKEWYNLIYQCNVKIDETNSFKITEWPIYEFTSSEQVTSDTLHVKSG